MTSTMSDTTTDDWSADLTALCERLAERLRTEGYPHPVAAAVALAVRGRQGVDAATFAVELGIPADALQRVESGLVPLRDFPGALLLLADHTDGLDLDRLTTG